MFPVAMGLRETRKLGVVLVCWIGVCWIGANCIAVVLIDLCDSWTLEAEYGVPAHVIRSFECRTTEVSVCGAARPVALWYRYRPPPSSAKPQTVPLVVFLHGSGECGSDNVRQLRYLPAVLCEDAMQRLHPCAILAPQCPKPGGWAQRLDAEIDLLDGVLRMIDDVLADPRIDPRRIYLIGLSMGGYGAWELAMRAPERFAAVVPICGGGDQNRAASLRHVRLWAVHGADDTVVPVSESRKMIAAVESAGGKPRYLELQGVGHDCWAGVFREKSDVLAWMFQQTRNSASMGIGSS